MRRPSSILPFLVAAAFVHAADAAGEAEGGTKGSPASLTIRAAETGVASWYGSAFHGRRTASGEPYDAQAFTAAHRTLPLGTLARIVNLVNGRSVLVRINDRGPFRNHRLVDVSRGAAQALDMIDAGTTTVRIEVLDASAPSPVVLSVETESPVQIVEELAE